MNKLHKIALSILMLYLTTFEFMLWGHINHWVNPFLDVNGTIILAGGWIPIVVLIMVGLEDY